jgi:hypothetical protein
MSELERTMVEYYESDRIAETQKGVVDKVRKRIHTAIESHRPAALEDLKELQVAKTRLSKFRAESDEKSQTALELQFG